MAYRPSEARLDRDQALRQRILVCALQRVVDGGFAALTMQALAEDVGIATGSLYRHFRSKGELAAEVFADASQREVDALAATLRAPGSDAPGVPVPWLFSTAPEVMWQAALSAVGIDPGRLIGASLGSGRTPQA